MTDLALPSPTRGDRRRPGTLLAAAVLVAALAVLAVVLLQRGSDGSAPVLPAEAVAATPVDATAVVQSLGRGPMTAIPADDPLLTTARAELVGDGVDRTQGVRVTLADGTQGWLLGGNDTVCLVLPAPDGVAVNTNCEEATNARQHGVGRVLGGDGQGSHVDLVLPAGAAVPYVTADGGAARLRSAQLNENGTIASADVRAGENLVAPSLPGGSQRMFAGSQHAN